jgi:hypothetical protein
MSDPAHLEARLLLVAEMLDHAVREVRRAMDDVRGVSHPPPADEAEPNPDGRSDVR